MHARALHARASPAGPYAADVLKTADATEVATLLQLLPSYADYVESNAADTLLPRCASAHGSR